MITFENVDKSYNEKLVLSKINLNIADGEFMVLIGSSGCGKTTLLKSINKLHSINHGDIKIDGVSIKNQDSISLRRRIGYVVQDAGLFPHMTAAENIMAVLKINGYDSSGMQERVDELLDMVELDAAVYRDLYPCQLSGGQKQRIGVARAFAADPDIILMDEPFSALDPVTRSDLQDAIVKLQKKLEKTIVFVTHDMDEAIKLADRICIIQNGHIVQCDTPEKILKNPTNDYVKNFIGKNRLWSNPEFIKVKDIMLKNPCRISMNRTVVQAMQVMNHAHVDSVLVTENNKFMGIVWMEDLQSFHSANVPLADFISEDYHSVNENMSLKDIINIDYKNYGIIPVVNDCNELAGFLTKSRMLSVLSRQYQEQNMEEGNLTC